MERKTILLVEREERKTNGIRKILAENQYQTITAYGEADAMCRLEGQQVDYVLLEKNTAEKLLQNLIGEKLKDKKGNLEIDLKRRLVKKNGREIRLTATEYKLLATMAKSPNRVFSREELISYALGDDFHGYDRSIDTYIKGLREKIEESRKKPQYIRTVHGMGYKFVP